MGITEERIENIKKQAEICESISKAARSMSSELEGVLQDNLQMEQQIESLNEANDRLRERLNRGESHDGYMELPVDADGAPIRIGDVVNVDGDAMTVLGYRHDDTLLLIAKDRKSGLFFSPEPSRVRHFKLEPPDSWEKLEEDATQQSCRYFGMDRTPASCDNCPHGWEQTGRACWRNARLDMIARAKKLAGIEKLEGEER